MQKENEKFHIVKINLYSFLRILFIIALFALPTLVQHYAYVTNAGEMGDGLNDDLSIIDLSTNTVVATVPVGD